MDNGTPFDQGIGVSELEAFTWWYAYHATDEEKAAYKAQRAEQYKKYVKHVAGLKARLESGEDLSWEERGVILGYSLSQRFRSANEWFMFLKSMKLNDNTKSNENK
jgi:hypothetical protein